jgi:tetratricopeptide (TPR) repeat protein
MRWLNLEYVLKGIYLGLLVYVAWHAPDWRSLGLVALCLLGGLVLCLGWAAWSRRRAGYEVRGRLPAYVLFLLLESPDLVYAGTIMGLAVGALTAIPRTAAGTGVGVVEMTAGGAVLGLAFGLLRRVRDRRVRLGLSLAIAAGLVFAGFALFGKVPGLALQVALPDPTRFGVQLLLGMAVFYLLTFVGREEESEVEIGAICAALGVGVMLIAGENRTVQSLGLAVCVMLYFFYTLRVLPGLRVFKHALRGLSYAKLGRHRAALLCFRRALQLDPNNRLAREGLWGVHRSLDFAQLRADPQTLAVIDFDLCLQRAGSLLLAGKPSADKLEEAQRLLDLVAGQRPEMRPAVNYWRAVAHTHQKDFEAATAELSAVLDPAAPAEEQPSRRGVLFAAWQLALLLHPELKRRVGGPELEKPGRHLDAIGAVERRLAEAPDDAEAWNLKRLVYSTLTEAEYAGDGAAADFDHGYARELGLALIGDPARWQRGAEYLRVAARGLPDQAPALFAQIAQAHERAGDAAGSRVGLLQARQAGQAVGPKNLSEEARQVYFTAVKQIAESAAANGDLSEAIANYHLYLESERSGVETLRTLADLYERKGDPLSAARATEQGLVYNAKDKDLLDRKDKYYYSILPDDLKARKDLAAPWFDTAYCVRKARSLLDARQTDLDLLDWAQHLLDLALIMQPESLAVKVALARCRLRRGERDEAVALLEDVYTNKPQKLAGDDEEAWFLACRLLGEVCLYELGKPDRAVQCFTDFKGSAKSGADTLYKLGQAYEQLGDSRRAARCYENVTSYEGHPLAPDAREALYRLQAN